LKSSGFRENFVRDESEWRHLCTLFKYTLFLWQALHFIRGCVHLGPAHAQNDLIAITLLYPMLLCLIWTVVFIAVVITRLSQDKSVWGVWLLIVGGGFGMFLVSWGLCGIVGKGGQPLLVTFVCLHLCRQVFRIACRWSKWGLIQAATRTVQDSAAGAASSSVAFALDPHKDKELRRTYSVERKIGRIAIRVLALVCISFVSILAICVLMAGVQQHVGLFLKDIVWWRDMQSGVEIINSGASVLTLTYPNTSHADTLHMKEKDTDKMIRVPPTEEKPHYAICGHTWHGLQLVDYAMLSLVTYMNDNEQNDLGKLVKKLFADRKVRIITHEDNVEKERRWLEFEVSTCEERNQGMGCKNLTVISVSGTDPTRIMDYVENMRMWTEPVALQILSTVFPTVRIWPRDTTAMVIGGIHGILKSMDVADDRWHYRQILEYVRQIPQDRNVVITGHSLGGGISLVIGALTGRLAVALQPPGVYHSLAKHEALQAPTAIASVPVAVHKRSVSLVFEGDWIQNFDGHGGLVQTMNCDQSRSGKSVAVGCHLLEGAICHLLWHCGDEARRFATCQHEYQPTSTAVNVAKSTWAFLQESWRRSDILPHWDSVVTAGITVSAIMVARYGAPSLPKSIFPSGSVIGSPRTSSNTPSP